MPKDCYQQILDIYDEFPKQQKKIADFILTNFPEVIYYSVSKMSKEIGVSGASIVRFAKILGFKGFPEFREALFKNYKENFSPSERVKHLIEEFDNSLSFKEITEKEIYYLQKSINSIDEGIFQKTVHLICNANTVHILGAGPNEMLGFHLSFRLRRFKIHTMHHNKGGIHLLEGLLNLEKGDIAVAYDFYRPSEDLKLFINIMKRNLIPIILITDSITPLLMKECNYVLCAERGPHGTFHSPIVPLAITNAILVAVAYKHKNEALETLDLLETYRQEYFYNTRSTQSES